MTEPEQDFQFFQLLAEAQQLWPFVASRVGRHQRDEETERQPHEFTPQERLVHARKAVHLSVQRHGNIVGPLDDRDECFSHRPLTQRSSPLAGEDSGGGRRCIHPPSPPLRLRSGRAHPQVSVSSWE